MSEKIKLIVDGGKAGITPQMAQAMGPMKIDMNEVIKKINEKTAAFKGIKVPVEIDVQKDKSYNIKVGTPPASELIKNELHIKAGSGIPNKDFVGNFAIEDVIKIAKMKESSLFINNIKSAINIILGTCCQMGVLVEGKNPKEIIKEIKSGVYDSQISNSDAEVTKERRDKLKSDLEMLNGKFRSEVDAIKAKQEKKAEGGKEAGGAKPEAKGKK